MELRPKRMMFSISTKSHLTHTTNRSISSAKSSTLRPNQLQSINTLTNKRIHDPRSRAHSSTFESLSTTCWCLYDSKTNTQLGFRQFYQREIASLTKIMTTVVGLQLKNHFKLSPNLLVKVTEGASKTIGTTANLKYKTWIHLKDLFYGIMLPSGNDAAHLLAQLLGYLLFNQKQDQAQGCELLKEIDLTNHNTTLYLAEYIKAMNSKADQLQLLQTRFSNPHGLQNAMNISTAKDILKLSMYAADNQVFRKIMNCEYYRCYVFNEQKMKKESKIWQNTNILLKDAWEGVKTGQTAAAGNCLASLKNNIFIVVLNCPDSVKRFTQTKRLYQWYSQKRKLIGSTLLEGQHHFNVDCVK